MPVYQFRRGDLLRSVPLAVKDFYDPAMEAIALAAVERAQLDELTPVVTTDTQDIDSALSNFGQFIRQTERSPKTAKAYALEAEVFTRYLKQRRGKTLEQASAEDFWAYRAFRLNGPFNVRLAPRSWNKICAVLLRLIKYRKISCSEIEWAKFRASREDDDVVRAIDVTTYFSFRQDGLAQSRSPLRNTAFGELLITTGQRCAEGAALLRCELPQSRDFGKNLSLEVTLPASITKGNKSRKIIYSARVAREYVDSYVSEERSHHVYLAIDRHFPKHVYKPSALSRLGDFIFFIPETRSKIRIISGNRAGDPIPTAKLTIEERERLVEVENVSAQASLRIVDFGSLWIGEGGNPLSTAGWNSVFAAASDRLRKSTHLDTHVTPHALRHTFAVYTLNSMLVGLLGIRSRRRYLDQGGEIYERLVGDPLFTLQRLMGHRDIKTTYKYLRYVKENLELLDFAVAEWDRLNSLPMTKALSKLSGPEAIDENLDL
jgi:site-specific recombinase XerD